MPVKNFLLKNHLLDYIVILILGSGFLIFFYGQSFPSLSWSDEIVYAVMGRNIATGRGIISNFYHPRSIIERGYPLADVHMPGYSLILGLSFWLLGEREYAAFFPNHLAYLVTGLLLFWVGQSLFNRWTGFGSALVFYLFPGIVVYTHTAMSEPTLVLLSLLFFITWYKSLAAPRLWYSILLAVGLIAGLLHRESFLIFLPPALYTLWCWPQPERRKAVFYFGLAFILLLVIIVIPLYLVRAPYPHVMSSLLNAPDVVGALGANLKTSLIALGNLAKFQFDTLWVSFQLHLFFILIMAVFFLRLTNLQKKTGFYALYSLAGTVVLLALIYQVNYRLFMYLLLPLLVLPVGLLSQVKPAGLKYTITVLFICFLGFTSFRVTGDMARGRQREFENGMVSSKVIAGLSGERRPEFIFADSDNIFLYGWTHYPVTVIWSLEQQNCVDLKMVQQLLARLPIQVIAVREACYQDQIQAANREKLLPVDYILQGENQGYYVFFSSAFAR